MKIIIIDDEPKARETVRDILTLGNVDFELLSEADNVQSGVKAIRQSHPDLVLLDINLPDGNGFDVLKQVNNVSFKVIFITAFEDYAIKAFEFSAIDYLLKPIDPAKLLVAVKRAGEMVSQEDIALKLNVLFANLQQKKENRKKLVLHTDQKLYVVNTDEIIYCQAEGAYTRFHLAGGKILVSKHLKHYENLLNGFAFFRCHQSYLLNINYIDYYDKREGGFVVMKNKAQLPIAQRKRDAFYKLMNMF